MRPPASPVSGYGLYRMSSSQLSQYNYSSLYLLPSSLSGRLAACHSFHLFLFQLFISRWFSVRVSVSIVGLVICTVMLIVSILTNTSEMFILPTSILLSIFTGLYLTSCSGMLSRLPTRYSGALHLGMVRQTGAE